MATPLTDATRRWEVGDGVGAGVVETVGRKRSALLAAVRVPVAVAAAELMYRYWYCSPGNQTWKVPAEASRLQGRQGRSEVGVGA